LATVVIVDGADVCRAPIVEFTLRKQFAGPTWLSGLAVVSRGVEVTTGQRMCEVAALKLGLSTPATAFFEAHRSAVLTPEDLTGADLLLTAERTHRSAITRIFPEAKSKTFTWKEALVLADTAVDAVASGAAPRPTDLPALVALLARARGAVPLIEPPVQTAAFHWKPEEAADPLTTADGHEDEQLHRHTVEESYLVAAHLGQRFQELVTAAGRAARLGHPAGRDRWVHFRA
jgi:protein-tyrosine phosphatase